MKFAFIAAKMAEFPITVLCRMLEVSRAGFYASIGRPPSARAVEDEKVAVLVREAHERSRRTYGSPRVHVELAETHQVFVSRKRVIRLMQQQGLKARVRKRFKCTTNSDHDQPVGASSTILRAPSINAGSCVARSTACPRAHNVEKSRA